jgi:hypothetical protein
MAFVKRWTRLFLHHRRRRGAGGLSGDRPFALTAGLVYRKRKTKTGALLACAAASLYRRRGSARQLHHFDSLLRQSHADGGHLVGLRGWSIVIVDMPNLYFVRRIPFNLTKGRCRRRNLPRL